MDRDSSEDSIYDAMGETDIEDDMDENRVTVEETWATQWQWPCWYRGAGQKSPGSCRCWFRGGRWSQLHSLMSAARAHWQRLLGPTNSEDSTGGRWLRRSGDGGSEQGGHRAVRLPPCPARLPWIPALLDWTGVFLSQLCNIEHFSQMNCFEINRNSRLDKSIVYFIT